MSVAAAGLTLARAGVDDGPRWVIARHVFGSAVRWAIVWGFVYGLLVISTVKAYSIAYPTAAERVKAAASLQAFSILLGQPYHAETLAGFTSWRVTVIIALIGAIWALLTSTGLLRGEEDAGRWELLLSGPVTKLRATTEALLAFAGALGVMFAVTTLVAIAAGASTPGANFGLAGSVLFGLALVSGAAMFLAIGSLASQLSATRGQAATIAAAVLGGAFLVRMIADATKGLGWVRWITPLGWIEEIHPLRDPQPFALVPIAAVVAGCVVATLLIARDRDLGASALRERESTGEGRWLLGPTTLALRLVRGTAIGWIAGIAGLSFFTGFVTRAAASLFADSPAFAQVLGRLGVRRAAEGYLGFSFLTLALILAVMAAGQMASIRDEEASGRLDNLLVRPTRRLVWLAGRAGIVVALVLIGGIGGGIATWVGADSQHAGIPFEKLFEAGLNATVPGIFVAGIGVLAIAVRPRLTSAICYGTVAYSYLANLIGSLVRGQDWIKDSSIFTHIKLAPAVKPDWGEASVVVLIGVVAAVIGALIFQRRDIEYA